MCFIRNQDQAKRNKLALNTLPSALLMVLASAGASGSQIWVRRGSGPRCACVAGHVAPAVAPVVAPGPLLTRMKSEGRGAALRTAHTRSSENAFDLPDGLGE